MLVCALAVFVTVLIISNDPAYSAKYDISKIDSQLRIAIQITLALAGIISTLYINKIHDCKRDYIRYAGEMEAAYIEKKLWLEKIEFDKIKKTTDKLDIMYHHFQSAIDRFQPIPKLIIVITLVIFALGLWSLYGLNFDNMSVGRAILIITNWLLAVFLLFMIWLLYEDVTSTYYEKLKQVSTFVGIMKGITFTKSDFDD